MRRFEDIVTLCTAFSLAVAVFTADFAAIKNARSDIARQPVIPGISGHDLALLLQGKLKCTLVIVQRCY